MPFAGYADFADCVSRNSDKGDPKAYCASIQNQVEGKSDQGHGLKELPEDAQKLWADSFTEALVKNEPDGASKIAWATVYRRWEKTTNGAWSPLKVFDNIQFKSINKQDRIIFGAASVAIKDSDNQLITEDALKTAFQSYVERGQVLFYHKNIPVGEVLPSYAAPDGKTYKSGVNGKELDIIVRMYKDTQIANDVWKGIENGELRAFSIGGQVIGGTVKICETPDCSKSYERIDRIDLHEISIVPNPANEASYFTIIKSKVEAMSDHDRLIKIMELSQSEWAKARNCPEYTDKIRKIALGEDIMSATKADLTDLQTLKEAIVKEILEGLRKDQHADMKPDVGCPDGQHMVDGECISINEKTKSENMTATTEQKPTPASNPDPVKVEDKTAALEARIALQDSQIAEMKAMLAKALKPEASAEKVPDAVANLTEKKSVATDDKKETDIDWTKPNWKPGDNFEGILAKIRSK